MVTFPCVYKVPFVFSLFQFLFLQVFHPRVFMMFSKFPHADNIIFQESGNRLLLELVATKLAWWWSWEPLLTVTCPLHPFNSSIPLGGKRKADSKRMKAPSLFLPRHISFRSCFCSACHGVSISVSMENTEVPLTDPTSTFQTHYNRRTCSPPRAAPSSAGRPAAERHSWLESHVLKPGRAASLIVICIYRAELLYS